MKVYYNKFFTGLPYVNIKEGISFDTCYCGDISLLSLMMLHGGIPAPNETPEERRAFYHNHLLRNSATLIKESLFENSFKTDSYATGCRLLDWRDTLISAGWEMKNSVSEKLNCLINAEPENLPKGLADCWREVIKLSADRLLLPKETQMIICHKKEELEPKISRILDNQALLGLNIKYSPINFENQGNDIGKLKEWLIDGTKSKLDFTGDGSLKFLTFPEDDMALKYVALQKPEEWDLYLCQQPKKFDNILKYLGQPACGSQLVNCEPQVVNLFLIGNGLFEYPLNLDRILAWLEAPVNPLGRSFAHSLAHSLTSTGGIDNKEWSETIERYLDSKELSENDKTKLYQTILEFLPFPDSETIRCADVVRFNERLKNWANGILFLNDFPYEDIVREQLRQLDVYCQSLINLLRNYDKDTIKFIDFQNWCSSIVSPGTYTQYEPELGCRNMITRDGNIFSNISSLIWFCISDEETAPYPFDFLTEGEIETLKREGVFIYDRKTHNSFIRNAVVQTVLKTDSLTIVEAEKVNGEKVKRHPLMIQINEALGDKLKTWFNSPCIAVDFFHTIENVNNRKEDCYIKINEDVEIPLRFGLNQKESYSSIDLLIQHPFDYICKYIADLRDTHIPSMDDIKRTQGNVAHRMIELLFEPGSRGDFHLSDEKYQQVFDYAIQNTGLLLLRPENIMHYNDIKIGMKEAIQRLSEFIMSNNLVVDGTEVDLAVVNLLPDLVDLGSRCDMLLTDSQGNKVVLDFKWSYVPTTYIEMVKEGLSAQLIVYSYLIKRQFDCDVRSAYVSFPECKIISSDSFVNVDKIETETSLALEDKISMMANGIRFRNKQLADHVVEHTEGMPPEESDYYKETETLHLFPLKLYQDTISTPFDKDYLNLK